MANPKTPKPRHHGRDHLPGGEDPIPGLTGGNLPWCRVRMWANASNQSINANSETLMRFNDVQSDDPDGVFTGVALNGVTDGIRVNQDGLYLIRARMYWASASCPAAATIALNGIDADHFAPYNVGQVDTSSLTAGFVSTWARLEATEKVYVSVTQFDGAARELFGDGGNFLELCRIGSVSVTAIDGGP